MTDKGIYQYTPDYCHYYFDLVETNDLIAELKKNKQQTIGIFTRITPGQENFSYRPGKWTTKEVLRHLIDCERIYAYRAFRFSRFDNTELPGFDEDKYIANTATSAQSLSDLKEEYENVRDSTISLFAGMTNEMLDFKGIANKSVFTARALGFMTVGHNLHHCQFIESKYLNIHD